MYKIQIVDPANKTYKAFLPSDQSKSIKFKFFTDYQLEKNLKIFDFQEKIILHKRLQTFIITRINNYTNEIEIHIANASLIKNKLQEQIVDSQNIIEVKSTLKECIELINLNKIISINIKDEYFIMVLRDRLLKYNLGSLVTNTREKAHPVEVIFYTPILVSQKPYILEFCHDIVYLFQKNAFHKGKTNQIIINYKTINLKNRDSIQNHKITFKSPQVAQSNETMLSSVEKVKIDKDFQIRLKINTEFKQNIFTQKIFADPGELTVIKYCKTEGQKPEFGYIQTFSD
ncbi:unnamed protein product [Paramecium sonneborni]|uniref:Uncharacterized protein n=1 Tax=Paramecium sonneborni TaxID=65129 RepID=A0A8S1JXR5_9CILI|nr:unnamed protein product [Paramecium sonneborni]